MNVDVLTETERIDLMRFLCSFAWADGEVQAQERVVLERVLDGLNLSREALAKATAWLSEAPNMQGRDLTPLVRGENAPWRTEWFYEHLFEHDWIPKTEGVR